MLVYTSRLDPRVRASFMRHESPDVTTTTAPATPGAQSAQSQPNYQAFVDALAKRLGITSSALQTAVSQARTDVGLPANGGFGPGGPGGRAGGRGMDMNAAATAIGIQVTQLQQEGATKSLADVATPHGKNATDVANALKNAAHQRIDQDVTAGRMTADQATQAKQQADQRIDQLMRQVGRPNDQAGGPRGVGHKLDAAAAAIGIPVEQLQQELPGKTLSQVAQAHGKNPSD
jgi:hypothetical protein